MMITSIDGLFSPAATLRGAITGMVVLPDDDYNLSCLAMDSKVDQRPALILFPANAQDAAAGVAFAREPHLGVASQSNSHGIVLPDGDYLMISTAPNFFCFAYTFPANHEPTLVHL